MQLIFYALLLCLTLPAYAEEPPSFLFSWGEQGEQPEQFDNPTRLTQDSEDNIYVLDKDNFRIQIFDSQGELLQILGEEGEQLGQFINPIDIAVDNAGTIYVLDSEIPRIQMFDIEGTLLRQWEAKNNAFIAELINPQAIEIDDNGYVYVLDTGNFRIIVFTPDGDFYYEFGQKYDFEDPELSEEEGRFINPVDIAFNKEQRLIYVIDTEKNYIQYFSVDGEYLGYFGSESELEETKFVQPSSINVDEYNNLYFTDTETHLIQKFNSEGELLSIWGGEGFDDGLFDQPSGVAILGQNIYVSDTYNQRIQVFGQSYILELGKATGTGLGSIISSEGQVLCDATCKQIKLSFPQAITLSLTATPDKNSVFVGWEGDCTGTEPSIELTVEQATQCQAKFKDSALLRVEKIGFGVVLATSAAGETLACTPSCQGGYQQGDTVTLSAIAGDEEAFAYWVGDCLGIENPKTVTLDQAKSCTAIFSQYTSTFAGTGSQGLTKDITHASLVQLNAPYAIAFINEDELLIAERGNHLIRIVDDLGTTEIFAGTGVAGYSGDGYEATSAQFNLPSDIVVDEFGNVYIADTGNHVIRMITPDGIITTIAGTPRISGYSDGVLNAFDARFNRPRGIVYANGSLFIADTGNSLIRQLIDETVLTIAGNGVAGYLDSDEALLGQLNKPQDILVSSSGTLLIADTNNHVIRELVDGRLQTIAGNGNAGVVSEGSLALESAMGTPVGLANGKNGITYIADAENSAIWMLSDNQHIYKLIGFGENADFKLAAGAGLTSPMGLAVAKEQVYIAEAGNNKVRLIGALPEESRTFFSLPSFEDEPIQLTANVPVNTPIDTTIDIYNIGLANLSIDLISLEGEHASEFSIVTPFPLNLAQGTNTPLTVRCAPADVGARKALLRLSTTDEEVPEVEYLLYCANTPVFASKPKVGGLIEFDTVGIGQPSEKNLVLIERGAGDIQITNAEIIGEFADQFTFYSLEDSFPIIIADDSEVQELYVQCNPQTTGKYEATLVLTTNDPTQAQSAYHLSCQGVGADAELGFLYIDTSGAGFVERCGEECTKTFTLDTIVSLTAKPGSGWGFLGWSGDCNAEGQVQIEQENECIAHFAALSPQSGDVDGLYVNYGQTAEDLHIEEYSSISGGTLAGENISQGWISNVELDDDARIEGGNISGFNVNRGTMCDLRITNYSEVTGGEYCGEIENDGTLFDVEIDETGKVTGDGRFEGVIVNNGSMCGTLELGEETYILGGELGCEIDGDKDDPAIIGKSKIQENTVLDNVCLTATVELADNVSLGDNVTYNLNTGNLSLQSFCIEPKDLEQFDESRMRGTEEQAFATFDNEHIQALALEAFEVMTELQIAEFDESALEGMLVEQFEKLPPEILKGLDLNNMGGLPPEVIGLMNREHLAALNQAYFIELSGQEIAEFMTNFNAELFTVDDIDEYLPEDWGIEIETGELLPPVGAKLACKSLPSPKDLPTNVVLPNKKFDLNTDLSLGGKKADNTILQDFNNAADSGSNFNQQDDGVVLGQISGKQYAFIIDVNNVQQLDAKATAEVKSDAKGQFTVTTTEQQQFPLLPAPKSPTALANVLGDDSKVELNEWGDVLLKIAGEYVVVIFSSEIETAEGEQAGFYPPNGENTRAIREGRVVYDDGTSQTTYPAVLYPETFIGLVEQIAGVESVIYNVDGSYSLIYNSQSLTLLPNYGAITQSLDEWERIDPSLALVDGSLQYKVQNTGNKLLVTLTLTISFD
ncbi:choice-of-anchor D domain-containing protein [Candidatus Albibeggiatoa sp. nov. BB20]|uniref:NHL domain-containing protein n=1 Tax=Candidatus Albibeggiatoa sp. nov. BB20 TaxID=3162723 RepID=UPI003365A928